MFSVSRPCECDVISLYFMCCSVNGSVCLVLRVCELFVETIRNCLGIFVILLLNVMEVFSVGGGALLDNNNNNIQYLYSTL